MAPTNAAMPESTESVEVVYDKVVEFVSRTYQADVTMVTEVVAHVAKYQDAVFPKASDILAVISIESRWNPHARSGPSEDPSVGLTQIKPKQWRREFGNVSFKTTENQVKYAAMILRKHFVQTKSKRGAILAYNAGIGNYLIGQYTSSYYDNFERASKQYTTLIKNSKRSPVETYQTKTG